MMMMSMMLLMIMMMIMMMIIMIFSGILMSNMFASYPLITDFDRLHYWSIYLWTSSIILINLSISLVYIVYASVVSLIYLRVNYSATSVKKDLLIESLSADDDFDGNAHHHHRDHRDNTTSSCMGYDNKKDGSNDISGGYSKASNRSNSYKRIKCPSVSTERSASTTLSIVSFIIIIIITHHHDYHHQHDHHYHLYHHYHHINYHHQDQHHQHYHQQQHHHLLLYFILLQRNLISQCLDLWIGLLIIGSILFLAIIIIITLFSYSIGAIRLLSETHHQQQYTFFYQHYFYNLY